MLTLSSLAHGLAATAQNAAAFVSQSVPASMTTGQSYPVSITLKNTGSTVWSNTTGAGTPNSYSLGSQNPQDNLTWGSIGFPGRVAVAGSVQPGATTTFDFTVVAPATPGVYNFQWQMVEDYVAWFGEQTPNVQIVVSAPAGTSLNAEFVSQSVPASMTTGQSYPVSITLKNTGSTVWSNTTGAGTPNSYSLGSQNPQDNLTWGLIGFPGRVAVAGSVQPGAATTFDFTVVAPATPGVYNFQWQMVEDDVAWFGDQTRNLQVVVTPAIDFVPGPISFVAAPLTFAQPVIGDIDGDSWPEPFGTSNDRTGQLSVLSTDGMGLQGLFSDVRPNDFRIADLNGDGCMDLVAQGYSAYSPSANVDSRALLFLGSSAGKFTEDTTFANLNFNGRGEGLVVADFNNDGATDLYLPYYTFGMSDGSCIPYDGCPNAPQSYLLLNDGAGHFAEGDLPGTVDPSIPPGGQPEGVQAVDINDDGRIDLYVAGHLFLNLGPDTDGRLKFVDCNCGVPPSLGGFFVDEGAKFLDWNNDGKLDLVLQDPDLGPQLYQNVGTRAAPEFQLVEVRPDQRGPEFAERTSTSSGITYSPLPSCASYGINVYDLDNDGLEDVIVAGSMAPVSQGCDYPSVVFRNTGLGFESVSAGDVSGWEAGGVFAFGDINRDGRIDAMYVGPYPYYFVNSTSRGTGGSFSLEILGANGARTQHGRVVRVSVPKQGCGSPDQSGCTLTRVVDGGSGYHSQNQYPVLVGTPYPGKHGVSVMFPDRMNTGATVVVNASVGPGEYAQIVAPSLQYPNGRVSIYKQPPLTNGSCRAR